MLPQFAFMNPTYTQTATGFRTGSSSGLPPLKQIAYHIGTVYRAQLQPGTRGTITNECKGQPQAAAKGWPVGTFTDPFTGVTQNFTFEYGGSGGGAAAFID